MKLLSLLALVTLVGTPAFAQETRQLDSHEHGVGQLDVAFDGAQIAMELHAPGSDIVGFEYAAESAQDIAMVESALLVLAQPLELFVLPETARCRVIEAHAELEGEEEHDEHEGEDHEHHDDEAHEGEDHEAHEEDADHDEHGEEAGHTEFHAEYLLNCTNPSALNTISFAYFTAFPNALEVEVQVISEAGAKAFEVERDAPMLDLGDLK
jgi:hypothetical protein